MLTFDLLNTRMNLALGRTVGRAMNGLVFGTGSSTNFDYADNVALLAKRMSLLQSTLVSLLLQEAAPLGV